MPDASAVWEAAATWDGRREDGKESVWDYPRPPVVVRCERRARVELGGETIADSERALRVLETTGPPTIYFPPADVRSDVLEPAPGKTTVCEWKGTASYHHGVVGEPRAELVAWSYPQPTEPFEAIAGYVAFFAGRADAAYLDDERVEPQPGEFYGGWITADIAGPFKGSLGTASW